jgi:hypothetical protein
MLCIMKKTSQWESGITKTPRSTEPVSVVVRRTPSVSRYSESATRPPRPVLLKHINMIRFPLQQALGCYTPHRHTSYSATEGTPRKHQTPVARPIARRRAASPRNRRSDSRVPNNSWALRL